MLFQHFLSDIFEILYSTKHVEILANEISGSLDQVHKIYAPLKFVPLFSTRYIYIFSNNSSYQFNTSLTS